MATEHIPSGANKYHEGKKPKDIRQVTSGAVTTRKPSQGRKFLSAFFKSDIKTLKEYLIEDQIIPSLQEIALRTFEMLIFGDSSRSSASGSKGRGPGWTEKKQYNKSGSVTRSASRSGEKSSGMSKFIPEVDEVYLETRGDAERTVEYLKYLLDEYDEVTVADLYESVGKTADWSLNSLGWTDLDNVYVTHTRWGYRIELPRPEPLD